jgi:hypothetical protein
MRAEVVERFSPLLSAFDFTPTDGDAYAVRFEKPGAFVEITFDAGRSRELDVWVGRVDGPEPPLELADVVRATDCPPETVDDVQLMQARDSEVLVHLLDRALAVLDTCGRDFLRGDPDAFARAKALRSARSVEPNRQARTAPYVADADRAWERKDYRTVHALLEPIRNDLDATHRRRLDFAARRL